MPPTLRCPSSFPQPTACINQLCKASQVRSFSVTPRQCRRERKGPRITRARTAMYQWLGRQGEKFRDPIPGQTNYLSAYDRDGVLKRVKYGKGKEDGEDDKTANAPTTDDKVAKIPSETISDRRPFPLNPFFISQPVLSEQMREKIWEAIMLQGKSVRDVSYEFSVDVTRVGAVVRLKEIEKEWERIGKPIARPYADAVMTMLPVTEWVDKEGRANRVPHESINDLPVHPSTGQQIFYPTSESRVFTRQDAARAFDEKLLPADDRVPHPELITMHRDLLAGFSQTEITERQEARDAEVAEQKLRRERRKQKLNGKMKVVDTKRWEIKFTEVNSDVIGKNGRGPGAGWRYGFPLMDRSRAQVKIPTKVE